MKYSITEINKARTTTGKDKADVTLNDGTKATMWGDFPGYATLQVGSEIEANLTPAKDPKYKPSLSPVSTQTTYGGANRGYRGGSGMKSEEIKQAQERKSESISYFNSVNSAISLVSKFDMESMGEAELRVKLVAWRDWFLEEYEKWNNQPF